MARFRSFLSLSALVLAAHVFSPAARAGDEDVGEAKKKAEQKTPEDTALPKDVEAPEMSVGDNQEPSPDFVEQKPTAEETAPKRRLPDQDPDANIDYSRLLDSVETAEASRGVLPPAPGFRGYRPSMIAVGAGDRVPGYGAMIEFSWNRIGAGITGSYHYNNGQDPTVVGYGIAGLYGLYRWLPFDISPYFLMGVEAGFYTADPVGGMLGGGVEARIYSGWTALLGWTFHSTTHNGFLGGAIGWSF
jgi:hypothetical protein